MTELNDAIEGKAELPSKPILITFDDGYYSNYEYIYPILKQNRRKLRKKRFKNVCLSLWRPY